MPTFDDEQLNKKFEAEYEKLRNEVQKPGILLAGQTGVGKSTLVNMIFGEELALTDTGKPVTKKIDCFETETSSVRIYDSKGYETNADGDTEFFDDVIGRVKNQPEQHAINIIWYCISCLGARVTNYDLNAIKAFAEAQCPLAVVLTKADKTDEETIQKLRRVIKEADSTVPIFETSTYLPQVNQTEQLIAWSAEHLPEQLQFAFISQQKISFSQKRKRVKFAIAEHVVSAGIVGAIPIPVADAPILAANEMALMARILYLYDLGGLKNTLKGVGIGGLLTKLGKFAVGSLLKFIPIVGSAVGAAIQASVAVALTWAFGGGVALACEKLWNAKLNGENVEELFKSFDTIVETFTEENIKAKRTSEETIFDN